MTPPQPLTHRQVLVIFSGLLLGMLLAALDQTIVATALPRITGDLGGLEHLSWVISAYLLASTIAMPLAGKLGDLLGRKFLFQVSIVVFLVGSVLAGMAQDMGQLIAFRALQGLGGGGLMVLAMSIIAETVPPRERGRYQGYFGATFGLSSIAGPLLGGFITDNLSWRWAFYVNLPVGLIALLVITFVVPKGTRHERPVFDIAGITLMAFSVTLLVLITTWGGTEHAWGSPLILGMIAVDLTAFVALVVVELRAQEPVIPVRLFRIKAFTVSTVVSFIIGLAMFGSLGFLPLYLQTVTGSSATASGLAMFPMMGGVLITSIASGRLISRTGRYKIFPVLGTGIAAVGLGLLSTIDDSTARNAVSLYMFVLGAGLGFVMQVMILTAQNAVKVTELGAATGSVSFFREIGGCIGIATFGAVFTSSLQRRVGSIQLDEGLSIDLIERLPGPQQATVISAIAESVSHVFLFAVPLMVLAFAVTWTIREVTLRGSTSAVEHGAIVEVVPEMEMADA